MLTEVFAHITAPPLSRDGELAAQVAAVLEVLLEDARLVQPPHTKKFLFPSPPVLAFYFFSRRNNSTTAEKKKVTNGKWSKSR